MSLAVQLAAIRDTLRLALVAHWSDARVEIGDENLSEHVGAPVIVLCYATGEERPPRDLNTNPPTIAERVWDIEAHVWIAQYSASASEDDRDVARLADLETMLDELSRAVYSNTHGSIGGGTPLNVPITISRDVEIFRFGEAAVALFKLGRPVTYGPTLEPVENAAAAVEGDGSVMNVNTFSAWGA